ncbi:metal ABC transporter solute-binding protein, Zn/Mn family [Schumannella luteola]
MKTSLAIGAVAASALLLAGCSAPATPDGDDSRISVVASTNVYGDLAATIGGNLVDVTSIITGANQDPHSFEASARDQLAVSEADLVILNGGGYDPFMETLVAASGTTAPVIEAVEASGLLDDDHDDHADDDHADDSSTDATDDGHDHIEGFNEHVWYDLHGVIHVVEHIAEELAAIDAANADTYTANADALTTELESLEARADELHTALEGEGAAMTEPVPGYLLAAVGLDNLTPEAFTEAIEEGADVPPTALQQTLDLFADNAVVVLAYNSQTASPETERVRAAAQDAGVPVLDFTETLPDGQTYVSWMTANLDAIQAALT